jgi:predicted nucleotidyltransferase
MKKLSEATKISEKDKQLLLEVKEIVLRHVPDAQVLLYGSVARGTQTPESDYDLLILTPSKLSRDEEKSLRSDTYELELDKEVVFSVFTEWVEEWERPIMKVSPYYKNVNREAISI